MPDLNFAIGSQGPLVNVDISPSSYFQQFNIPAGSPVPTIKRARFLVDTGASNCLVNEDTIAALQLHPISGSIVRSVSGVQGVKRPIFDLSLLLYSQVPAQGWLTGSVFVSAQPAGSFRGVPFDGLIGRDLLNHCSLFYDGPAQRFRISY